MALFCCFSGYSANCILATQVSVNYQTQQVTFKLMWTNATGTRTNVTYTTPALTANMIVVISACIVILLVAITVVYVINEITLTCCSFDSK